MRTCRLRVQTMPAPVPDASKTRLLVHRLQLLCVLLFLCIDLLYTLTVTLVI